MPDVGSQLAEYFEAAVERIDAEDVMAHVTVAEQLTRRTPPRRLRPTWAAAVGFAGVLVLVGGTLLAGWLLHDPSGVQPQPLGTPAAETGGGWDWWPLVIAGAAAVIGIVVLVSRRLRRATKEVEMQTLDEKQREAAGAQTPRRSRRAWIVGLAIVVVVAAAIGAWAVIDANQTDGPEIATNFADVEDIAWMTADGDALAALFTEDGVYVTDTGVEYKGRDAISALVNVRGFMTERQHGDITEIGDGVYTYPVELVHTGTPFTLEMRITIEGDLVSNAEALSFEVVDG